MKGESPYLSELNILYWGEIHECSSSKGYGKTARWYEN